VPNVELKTQPEGARSGVLGREEEGVGARGAMTCHPPTFEEKAQRETPPAEERGAGKKASWSKRPNGAPTRGAQNKRRGWCTPCKKEPRRNASLAAWRGKEWEPDPALARVQQGTARP